MLERRTFIVRVHGPEALPILEDVATGERVRLPSVTSLGEEIARRLDHSTDDAPEGAAAERLWRP